MYLDKRQNPLLEVPEQDVEGMLTAVATHFDEGWLQASDGEHPLQQLWRRSDFLSTNELATLGHAILVMGPHTRWITEQVRLAKGRDPNNARGALFELIGLALLSRPACVVEPHAHSHPGVDARLRYATGGELPLSLKSYHFSSHRKESRRYSTDVWTALRAQLAAAPRPPLSVVGSCADKTPSATDWITLRRAVELGTRRFTGGTSVILEPPWAIRFSPIAPIHGRFAEKHPSLHLILLAHQHRNEQKNFISKLDEARANLEKHSGGSIGVLLIRLPPGAPIGACRAWSQTYLAENPASPLAGVLLFQAAVAALPHDTTGIALHIEGATGGRLEEWRDRHGVSPPLFAFRALVGTPVDVPIQQHAALGDGSSVALGDYYVFQRGDLYVLAEERDGTATGNVRHLGDGVFLHSVFSISGKEMVLSGKFPPSHDLLIL
jgi:hypothetical protein